VNEPREILTRCHQYGIRLGLGLRVEGWSKAPADLQEDIRSHRDELLNLLLSQSSKNGFDAERSTDRTTLWGIPIADGYDPADPVFQRPPLWRALHLGVAAGGEAWRQSTENKRGVRRSSHDQTNRSCAPWRCLPTA